MTSSDHGILPDLLHGTQDDSTQTGSSEHKANEDGGDYCRICRGEGSNEQPLFYPCKCSGSIRFVHQDCLMEWLSHSKKKYCELCKTPFRFTKLYDKSMPAVLPVPHFLKQLVFHFCATLSKWARYVFVACVWSICLPWAIRQVWRGLFWLADGSWLSEGELSRSNMLQDNATINDLKNLNPSISQQVNRNVSNPVLDSLLNWSTSMSWSHNTSSGESLVSTTLRFMSGESLVNKIFRLPYSVSPLYVGTSPNTNETHVISSRRILRRPASLLSDVKVVNSLSLSPFLNHMTLDVLEGIMICLTLVAGFILIFLIREWVINQQPMLNMLDADLAERPPGPPRPHANDVRPIIRARRRRIVPRDMDGADQADANAVQAVRQPLPFIPPRRAMTDDNIGVPAPPDFEPRPLPTRSQSDANALSELDLAMGNAQERGASPPPLLRGAIGEVVNVHRTMEEAPVTSDKQDLNLSRHFAEPEITTDVERLQSLNQLPHETHPRPSTPVIQFEPNVEVIGTASSQSPLTVNLDTRSSSDSDSPMIPTPDSSQEDLPEHESVRNAQRADGTVPSETGSLDTADDTDASATEIEDSSNEADEPVGEPEEPELVRPPLPHADRLANWLWQVEGAIPTPQPLDTHDDMQIVADIHAEAPFVPVHNPAVLPENDVLRAQAPPANIEQALDAPNLPQNVDWNDANAVEEIEDLEGVLELIGMEGPLVGMMQNVIFSLFLITVTLTASVWIPYIWGKITLLLLAHPVVVLVKAPVFLLSNAVDLIADVVFFILGIMGILIYNLTNTVTAFTTPRFPPFSRLPSPEVLRELSLNVTHQSGSRLEKTLASTFLTINPDLPAFSVQSHRALMSFKSGIGDAYSLACKNAIKLYQSLAWQNLSYTKAKEVLYHSLDAVSTIPSAAVNVSKTAMTSAKGAFDVQLKPLTVETNEIVLVDWSTQDKIIAVVIGYVFFFILGYVFLRVAHFALGLKKDEKVEGSFADGFRQASGVLKVIIIIGIEMIIFPLYCGLLLDVALLPLFEGATMHTRLAFIRRAPFTGLFLHWFVGTCYMFHFALFVSICRKILRKGVLYFIRDPDDPTFHPVRDVLERPVPTQLGKIAFSALVYGGLVIMCLGGVVWGVGRVRGVLPIRWSTPEPRLAFPADVIFYNVMLPFIIRKVEPAKKLSVIYEWWFRGCAHGLRLTQYLFGEEREDEKSSRRYILNGEIIKNGTYVRAPAADSCRIPKDKVVFLEVDENNERLDGEPDNDKGLHGKNDEKWVKVYLPPQFKSRVATFVVLLWMFAAGTGVAFTIGPLLAGRAVLKYISSSPGPVNDLYAFTVGSHLFVGLAYAVTYGGPKIRVLISEWKSFTLLTGPHTNLPCLWSTLKDILGLTYLLTAFGVVFPLALSIIAELYIHVPIFTYLDSRTPSSSRTPTIFLLQTWTLGLLYLRLAFRIALNYPCPHTRLATAIRAVFQRGYLTPDVRLASRAIVLPLTALCIVLLAAPTLYASVIIAIMHVDDPEAKMRIQRLSFPGLMGLAIMAYGVVVMKRRLEVWRIKVRDEVYLVGERLHNYADKRERRRLKKQREEERKLKEKDEWPGKEDEEVSVFF